VLISVLLHIPGEPILTEGFRGFPQSFHTWIVVGNGYGIRFHVISNTVM